MTISAILDLRLKKESLATACEVVGRILTETRAFEGCEGVDVLIDADDETHWLCFEKWSTAEADAAYREWRAGPGMIKDLGPLLAGAPGLAKYTLDSAI
ncbi:putative quinol monooxygenase [Rhodococcus globerulus]|uniref:putative quinol monooxygenase n=1 Tax=Rhodococcus globerulus TaxID=33008 RepID=UPI001F3E92E3|nr:antibiotic biosynthesis monooxygenase [Rhodococcus globerulus]MCE4268750.1 antibiotic biosynthesis monooxygenase [Rhodococcus globerulus]